MVGRLRLVVALWFLLSGVAGADNASAVIDAMAAAQREARAAQREIDAVQTERQRLVDERALIEADGTRFALRLRELDQTVSELRNELDQLDTAVSPRNRNARPRLTAGPAMAIMNSALGRLGMLRSRATPPLG